MLSKDVDVVNGMVREKSEDADDYSYKGIRAKVWEVENGFKASANVKGKNVEATGSTEEEVTSNIEKEIDKAI